MALSVNILNQVKPFIPSIDKISIQVLIEAYNLIIIKKEYSFDWEEEQFSSLLISEMNKQYLTTKWNLNITTERKLLNENKLPINENNPKYLPRIDISITSWLFEKNKPTEYFFEAKNLCEKNWKKSDNTRVSAKYYLDRYISTGVENFRIKKYFNGILIGYILQGDKLNIINALNSRLLNNLNTIQEIKNSNFLSSCSDIYHSKHQTPATDSIEIKHIFLKF